MRLTDPLDFYAVTDHAELLGIVPAMADPSASVAKTEVGERVGEARSVEERQLAFRELLTYLGDRHREILDPDIVRGAWEDTIRAANRNNEPGRLTTFIAYEFTTGPKRQNMHRNVIFRGARAPRTPFTRFDSHDPAYLWSWMDDQRESGMDALAIPHNSNASNGRMFELSNFAGEALDGEYAALRERNEPLVEVTQVKGTSETHPLLSPRDEWAGFELVPLRIASTIKSNVSGSYAREALLNGLELESTAGFNPFRFGLIGSSDTHNGATGVSESDYRGKLGLLDSDGARRGSIPSASGRRSGPYDVEVCPESLPAGLRGEDARPAERLWCGADADLFTDAAYPLWSASGLAGVWAEENSREAIFAALRRKETFATSGSRIIVRFFAGYEIDPALVESPAFVERVSEIGIPMGGELVGRTGVKPGFVVFALQDPKSAPLQRLQIIKGWVDEEGPQEGVYDVACADGLAVDPKTKRCPDNGAEVDLETCEFSTDRGDSTLTSHWTDPDFDPEQPAFYYVRVLENASCRWSTWDALRAGVEPRPDLPLTIQERAWTSPIWFRPAAVAHR
jgi:hypothetical protein